MINISIAAARLDINSIYGSLLLDLVDARIAYLNFIRLGDYVRKTHSAVVERPAPSSQEISGLTLVFREPYCD